MFGPSTLVVRCSTLDEMQQVADNLDGQLAACIHGTAAELREQDQLLERLSEKAGRVVCNGFPTGVEVSSAMHHGGPFPATTQPQATSVGSAAIQRFLRPVCYQDVPQELLPEELRDSNPEGILRCVDGEWTQDR